MPRTLTASRATVAPERTEEYLAVLADLAGRMRRRGQHFWVFRHPALREVFLEFSESGPADASRLRAGPSAEEQALEMKLRTLATYAPDAWVRWEEIPLEAG